MYGNLKYEQQQGESELPSLLSWRSKGPGIDNGVAPMDRHHPPLHKDIGSRFDNDRPTPINQLPVNPERCYEDTNNAVNLTWRKSDLGDRYEDATVATLSQHSGNPGTNGVRPQGPPRPSPNAGSQFNEAREPIGLSWRERQSGTNNTRPSEAPQRMPPAEERHRDNNEPAGLTWRSSQPPLGTNNNRPSEPSPLMPAKEERYRDEPAGLRWRSSQPPLGANNTHPSDPSPLVPPRDLDNSRPAEPFPLMSPKDTNNSRLSEPPSRIPPAEERYSDIDEASGLRWRSSQTPLGTNSTRPSDPPPLMSLRDTHDSRPSDPPPRIPPAEDRYRDTNKPGGLSWRSSQPPLGTNNARPAEPSPLMSPRRINDTHPSEPPPRFPLAEERYRDEPAGLSYRPSEPPLGTNNTRPSELSPRRSPREERYRDEPAGLSYRSSQPPLGTNNTHPSDPSPLMPPGEERYKDINEPGGLSWRSSQPPLGTNDTLPSGPTPLMPPRGTNDRRPESPPQTPPAGTNNIRPSGPSPLMPPRDERYRDINEPGGLTWRSSQAPLGTNDTRPSGPIPLMPPRGTNDIPPSRIPPAEERYKDISEPAGLSWRSSQPPLGTNDTRPSGPTPLMPQGTNDIRSFEPSRIPPADQKVTIQRYNDINEPGGLSWRSSQPPLGTNDTRPSEPPQRIPPTGANNTRPSEPTPLMPPREERYKDISEPGGLSWRSSQPPLGANGTRPAGPSPLMPPREERDAKESAALSWRATQSEEDLQNAKEPSTLNWRTIQAAIGNIHHSEDPPLTPAKGSNNTRLPEPTPLMPPAENRLNDIKEPVVLSWRSAQSGANHNAPTEARRIAPEERYEDASAAGLTRQPTISGRRVDDVGTPQLSWRSANSGAQGMRPPEKIQSSEISGMSHDDMKRPLSWRDAQAGGDLLAKRRYPDENPRLPPRDPYADRPAYPAKAFY